MLNIVLVEPEIPMNTGNIARTCAATGSVLHIVHPIMFDISDKAVKRAGLDYWHLVDVREYENIDDFFKKACPERMWLLTTKGSRAYTSADFREGDFLLFGKETKGLPQWLREKYPENCVRIPMVDEARSLNLANSVAIVAYEALRQMGFPGLYPAE